VADKIGRNDPCPCGSGLKYKKCCIDGGPKGPMSQDRDVRALQMFEKHRAEARLREAQQGYGRPISAFQRDGFQVVAVANRVFYSQKWKTFADFLPAYLKAILTPEWGNSELAKPPEEPRRLKDPLNFQGAYYELIVANILIRAGFTLVLEDETDGKSRHCEFAAISKHTGNGIGSRQRCGPYPVFLERQTRTARKTQIPYQASVLI
jgi:hypothetical protein